MKRWLLAALVLGCTTNVTNVHVQPTEEGGLDGSDASTDTSSAPVDTFSAVDTTAPTDTTLPTPADTGSAPIVDTAIADTASGPDTPPDALADAPAGSFAVTFPQMTDTRTGAATWSGGALEVNPNVGKDSTAAGTRSFSTEAPTRVAIKLPVDTSSLSRPVTVTVMVSGIAAPVASLTCYGKFVEPGQTTIEGTCAMPPGYAFLGSASISITVLKCNAGMGILCGMLRVLPGTVIFSP